MRKPFIILSILVVLAITLVGIYVWSPIYWLFVLVGPLVLLGWYDILQTRHSLPRVFPILGRNNERERMNKFIRSKSSFYLSGFNFFWIQLQPSEVNTFSRRNFQVLNCSKLKEFADNF